MNFIHPYHAANISQWPLIYIIKKTKRIRKSYKVINLVLFPNKRGT